MQSDVTNYLIASSKMSNSSTAAAAGGSPAAGLSGSGDDDELETPTAPAPAPAAVVGAVNNTTAPAAFDPRMHNHQHHQHSQDPWMRCSNPHAPLLPHGIGNCPPHGACPAPLPQGMFPPRQDKNRSNDNNNNNNDDGAGAGRKKKKNAKTDASYTSAKFSTDELRVLMDLIGEILPTGNPCWERLEAECNAQFPTRRRLHENLRKQCDKHANTKTPTGNPNIPWYVREAKRLRDETYRKSQAITLGVLDDDEDDTEDEGLINQIVGPPCNQLAALEEGFMDEDKQKDDRPTQEIRNGYETAASLLTSESGKKKRSGIRGVTTPGSNTEAKRNRGNKGHDQVAGLVSAFLAAESSRRRSEARKAKYQRARDKIKDKRAD